MDTAKAIEIARAVAKSHGDIEVDETPAVSVSDDGVFVQAWIFVRKDDIE